ncbi:polysaccharide biosynthesis tyrosine autokinase [Yoonia sp. BS5-3]|uniref:non-specific protein-tyrosine kinase n=1 Tax=Yoonia phaeophyticola TaxID=3137369 RepID=A0ABZ2V9M8_9RHOB
MTFHTATGPAGNQRSLDGDSDGIELRNLLGALRRNKWLILACILIAGFIAAASLKTVRPSYYSYVEVLLNTRQERVVGIEQVVSDLNVTNSVVAGEIAVLRSNVLLGEVVDKLDLVNHPDFNPYETAQPGLVTRASDFVTLQLSRIGIGVEPPEPLPETDIAQGLSPEDARTLVIWQVRRNLVVVQSGISYVISISMRAHDPDIAAKIANAVAEQYIDDQLNTKLAATQRAIDWLDRRLVELETQLHAAEDDVVEFQARQVLEEGGDRNSVNEQLAAMNRAIVTGRNERAAAEVRLQNVRRLMAEDGLIAAAAALQTPRLTSLDAEMAELERGRAQLATRLGPQHPDMLALDLALQDLARDRVVAIRAGVDALEAGLEQARGREQAIQEDIENAQLRLIDLSRASVRLSQLERSANAMRQVYESFLSRFQETTQQLEFQRPDARVITEAVPALSPARPRTKLILAVSLFLGAILGVALVVIREAVSQSVLTAPELTRATRMPVLSTLPRTRKIGRRGAAWQLAQLGGTGVSGYGEGLRLLRFGLLRALDGPGPHVVMLTSAERGAGCSTTVLGLGRVLSALGQRVAIVDADFRNPSQHKLLNIRPTNTGVAGYLYGAASLEEIMLENVEPQLSLVPARQQKGSAADMLSAPKFRTLMAELSGLYDIVLIDAPPTLGQADTTILASATDAVVVVARSAASRRTDVVSAIAALESAGGTVIGTVLSHTMGKATSSSTAPRAERPVEIEA